MWREWKATHAFEMRFRNLKAVINRFATADTGDDRAGIAYTHAPDVWALGFRGQGITVAGADTGQRWTHNALKPHYRGWDGVTADQITTGTMQFTIASESVRE